MQTSTPSNFTLADGAGHTFFKTEPGMIEKMPNPVVAHRDPAPVQLRQQLATGEIRLLRQPGADPGRLTRQRKWLLAAHRQRRRAAGLLSPSIGSPRNG